MSKKIKFLGFDSHLENEQLRLSLYEYNKDVRFLNLKEGQEIDLDNKDFELISQDLFKQGIFIIVEDSDKPDFSYINNKFATIDLLLENIPKDVVDITKYSNLVISKVPGTNYYDWSDAFIASVNEAIEKRGGTVYLPFLSEDDKYGITKTITNTSSLFNVLIKSDNTSYGTGYNINNAKTIIYSHVNGNVFEGKFSFLNISAMNQLIRGSLPETSFIKNIGTNNIFHKCKIQSYDYVIKEGIGQVGFVTENFFEGIRIAGISGSIVDSYVMYNYINGDKLGSSGINITACSLSTISGNFIDFCETGIRVTTQFSSSKIFGNMIDYCYRGIDIGGTEGSTIYGNTFDHCSKTYQDRLNITSSHSYYNTDWFGIRLRWGAKGMSINGNTAKSCDLLLHIKDAGVEGLSIYGNRVQTGKLIDYNNITIDVDVKIEELNNTIYTVQPTLQNTARGNTVIYNDFKYYREVSRLKLVGCMKTINQNYTVPVNIDLSGMPDRDMIYLTISVLTGNEYAVQRYAIIRGQGKQNMSMIQVFSQDTGGVSLSNAIVASIDLNGIITISLTGDVTTYTTILTCIFDV